MSDSRTMIEFREDLERGVPFPDFDTIEQRGRSVRRRRQIVPIAVVAIAALGAGLFGLNIDRDRGDLQPAPSPTVTETPQPRSLAGLGSSEVTPGDYTIVGTDVVADATVTLVGEGWEVWRAGGWLRDPTGVVDWALDEYEQVNLNPCLPDTHPPATRAQMIQMVTQIPGVQITHAAGETQVLGRPATHIGFSTLRRVPCPKGTVDFYQGIYQGNFHTPRVKVDLWAVQDVDQVLLLSVGTRGNPIAATLDQLDQTVASIQLASQD